MPNRARVVTSSLLASLAICLAITITGAVMIANTPLGWVLLASGIGLSSMVTRSVLMWIRIQREQSADLGSDQ
ncbi:MAG: hypothetical protein M3Y35_00580 [Actinomycetota bacterium]|nr:hypothetical protein [Actinomycetota bacterium]